MANQKHVFSLMNNFENYIYEDQTLPQDKGEISFEELQKICSRRIRAHKRIEQALIKPAKTYREIYRDSIKLILQEQDLLMYQEEEVERQKYDDRVSHFFLQTVFAKDQERQESFVRGEEHILRCRLYQHTNIEKDSIKLLRRFNFNIEDLDEREFEKYREDIIDASGFRMDPTKTQYNRFIKIDFIHVMKALERMKVFLLKGKAYVHEEHLLDVVVDTFGERLTTKLRRLRESESYQKLLTKDLKIRKLVDELPHEDMVDMAEIEDIKGAKVKLTIKNIDPIAKKSFPMCQRYLYEKLVEEHELKHHGRIQFGLFLKAAGMGVDDALYFWKFQYTKKVTSDEFEKGYAYNIRYNYGLEGQKKDFNAHSCQTIMTKSQPGPGQQYQGCPFKHFTANQLRPYLHNKGVPTKNLDEILALKQEHHYQLACKATFFALHPAPQQVDFVVDHPMTYFKKSLLYYNVDGTQEQQN